LPSQHFISAVFQLPKNVINTVTIIVNLTHNFAMERIVNKKKKKKIKTEPTQMIIKLKKTCH